jgi:Tfp pilus assembly PilM family ATPase
VKTSVRAIPNQLIVIKMQSLKVSLEDLEITIQRINELKEDEDEDEYGEITLPTEYALLIKRSS